MVFSYFDERGSSQSKGLLSGLGFMIKRRLDDDCYQWSIGLRDNAEVECRVGADSQG
jgi:hypothetical protein